MKNWRDVIVTSKDMLVDTVKKIDTTGARIALVVNEIGHLEGIITDGDVRRAILKSNDLNIPVSKVMNRNPMTVLPNTPKHKILSIMRKYVYHQIPIVDKLGKISGLATLDELIGVIKQPNKVVLMAGGLGKRLRPLTNDIPKPMLSIGGKPILETIIEGFINQGYHNFYISVNYKAEIIQEYFGNGNQFGAAIKYIQESKSMGTAGALSLIQEQFDHPLIVMNGDLLTHANIENMIQFHHEHEALATMAVREYDFQVPFGVVKLDEFRIQEIEEKPLHKFFVNAGLYILSPDVLKYIPKNQFFDMPSLFEKMIENNINTFAFPLHEYWLDIGRMEEFERAQKEWGSKINDQ